MIVFFTAFVAGYMMRVVRELLREHADLARRPSEIRWWHRFVSRRTREYLRLAKRALPAGTRVKLVCGPGCGFHDHGGVWRVYWTPIRLNDIDGEDDYLLMRDDGETTYAHRNAIEVVIGQPQPPVTRRNWRCA